MTDAKMTADEVVDSLTGFDEIAIRNAFGMDILKSGEDQPATMLRSLAFVLNRREGMTDSDAKNAALSMTLGEVNALFEEDEDEAVPDDPSTPLGKDDSPSESRPRISPLSA